MSIYTMHAWCVVQQTERGEQFAADARAFDPLRHALYIAASYNEAHAKVSWRSTVKTAQMVMVLASSLWSWKYEKSLATAPARE